MDIKRSLTILGLFAAAQGCISHTHDDGGGAPAPRQALPGDLALTWSFAGGSCSDFPDIRSIRVDVLGEKLHNGGLFPCLVSGYPGIVLEDFRPGGYTFLI